MKTIFATGLAAIALATAGSAHAATSITYDEGPTVDLTPSADGTTYSGSFAATVTGSGEFSALFDFLVPSSGIASIAGVTILSDPESNITFTSGLLDGTVPFTITNGSTDIASLFMQNISGGTHTFQLNGVLSSTGESGVGGIGGNISYSLGAVPEPATWALFILGFGAVGGAMRSQANAKRKVRSRINFA